MLLTIIIVSILPMILVSSIILYQFDISDHKNVQAHLEELVLKHKQNIDRFLKEKLADIRLMAKTFSYEELTDTDFLKDRLDLLQQVYGPVFVDLGVVNSRGLQIAYAGPFNLGKALYSSALWFQKSMESDYFKSDVFLGLRGLPHFIIAVRENHDGEQWILRATIDFVAFNNLVEKIRIGETGFAFILNKNGEFQTKPLVDLVPDKEPLHHFFSVKTKSFDNGVRIMERDDDFGNNTIYAAAPLKHGDWLLVYQQKASDAFSDLRSAIKTALMIMFIAMILVVTIAFLLSKKMVHRIEQADKEKEMMNEQGC